MIGVFDWLSLRQVHAERKNERGREEGKETGKRGLGCGRECKMERGEDERVWTV